MADGILCTHCGSQETNHLYGDIDAPCDPDKIYKGRTHSLLTCKNFEPEDPRLASYYTHKEQEDGELVHARSKSQARVLPMLYNDILPTLLLIARSKR